MPKKYKLKRKYRMFLLLYFTLLTSVFTLITFSKYTTMASINGNKTVAKWNVSVIGSDNQSMSTIIIGDSSTYQNYNFSVTSLSEVAITYSLLISNVPTGFQIQVDNGIVYSENNNVITITDLGNFSASDNSSTHNHTLTLMAPLGISAVSNQTINIEAIFTQIEA